MFERLNDRARKLVVGSKDEAELLGHEYIGTEHLLLSLLRQDDIFPTRFLTALGASPETVSNSLRQIIGDGAQRKAQKADQSFTRNAVAVLEDARSEMLKFGDNYVGPEHIAVVLVQPPSRLTVPTTAVLVLTSLGIDLNAARLQLVQEIVRLKYDVRVLPD